MNNKSSSQLLRDGFVVLKLSDKNAQKCRDAFTDFLTDKLPEFNDDFNSNRSTALRELNNAWFGGNRSEARKGFGPMHVAGAFGACSLASSYYHRSAGIIDRIALKTATQSLADVAYNNDDSQCNFLSIIPDRMCFRIRKPEGESWHTDNTAGAIEGDKFFGGFVNLNHESEMDSLLPAQRRKFEQQKRKMGYGIQSFTLIPKQFDLKANLKGGDFTPENLTTEDKQRGQTVLVPPGHMIVFFENIVHMVHNKEASFPIRRKFVGFMLRNTDEQWDPIPKLHLRPHIPITDLLTKQASLYFKGGQISRMFPRLYENVSKHKLPEFSKPFVDGMKETKTFRRFTEINEKGDKTTFFNVEKQIVKLFCPSLMDLGKPYSEKEADIKRFKPRTVEKTLLKTLPGNFVLVFRKTYGTDDGITPQERLKDYCIIILNMLEELFKGKKKFIGMVSLPGFKEVVYSSSDVSVNDFKTLQTRSGNVPDWEKTKLFIKKNRKSACILYCCDDEERLDGLEPNLVFQKEKVLGLAHEHPYFYKENMLPKPKKDDVGGPADGGEKTITYAQETIEQLENVEKQTPISRFSILSDSSESEDEQQPVHGKGKKQGSDSDSSDEETLQEKRERLKRAITPTHDIKDYDDSRHISTQNFQEQPKGEDSDTNTSDEETIAVLRQKLTEYKKPREIDFGRELSKKYSGELKDTLTKVYQERGSKESGPLSRFNEKDYIVLDYEPKPTYNDLVFTFRNEKAWKKEKERKGLVKVKDEYLTEDQRQQLLEEEEENDLDDQLEGGGLKKIDEPNTLYIQNYGTGKQRKVKDDGSPMDVSSIAREAYALYNMSKKWHNKKREKDKRKREKEIPETIIEDDDFFVNNDFIEQTIQQSGDIEPWKWENIYESVELEKSDIDAKVKAQIKSLQEQERKAQLEALRAKQERESLFNNNAPTKKRVAPTQLSSATGNGEYGIEKANFKGPQLFKEVVEGLHSDYKEKAEKINLMFEEEKEHIDRIKEEQEKREKIERDQKKGDDIEDALENLREEQLFLKKYTKKEEEKDAEYEKELNEYKTMVQNKTFPILPIVKESDESGEHFFMRVLEHEYDSLPVETRPISSWKQYKELRSEIYKLILENETTTEPEITVKAHNICFWAYFDKQSKYMMTELCNAVNHFTYYNSVPEELPFSALYGKNFYFSNSSSRTGSKSTEKAALTYEPLVLRDTPWFDDRGIQRKDAQVQISKKPTKIVYNNAQRNARRIKRLAQQEAVDNLYRDNEYKTIPDDEKSELVNLYLVSEKERENAALADKKISKAIKESKDRIKKEQAWLTNLKNDTKPVLYCDSTFGSRYPVHKMKECGVQYQTENDDFCVVVIGNSKICVRVPDSLVWRDFIYESGSEKEIARLIEAARRIVLPKCPFLFLCKGDEVQTLITNMFGDSHNVNLIKLPKLQTEEIKRNVFVDRGLGESRKRRHSSDSADSKRLKEEEPINEEDERDIEELESLLSKLNVETEEDDVEVLLEDDDVEALAKEYDAEIKENNNESDSESSSSDEEITVTVKYPFKKSRKE